MARRPELLALVAEIRAQRRWMQRHGTDEQGYRAHYAEEGGYRGAEEYQRDAAQMRRLIGALVMALRAGTRRTDGKRGLQRWRQSTQ